MRGKALDTSASAASLSTPVRSKDGDRSLASGSPPTLARRIGFAVAIDTEPMEAKSADDLPVGQGWQFEPKWDGFRCLAYKAGEEVDLRAKSGKPLGRYFPEVVAMLRVLAADSFVLDGELVIEIDGRLAFDALQMRLHPAESRIRKLSRETPARYVAFDMLAAPGGAILIEQLLTERRDALEALLDQAQIPKAFILSPATHDRAVAENWERVETRRHRWGCRQAARRPVSIGRTRDGQGEATKVRRLRRWWLQV